MAVSINYVAKNHTRTDKQRLYTSEKLYKGLFVLGKSGILAFYMFSITQKYFSRATDSL